MNGGMTRSGSTSKMSCAAREFRQRWPPALHLGTTHLGEEVCDGRVVAIGALAHEEGPLVGKDAERRERGEGKEREQEEEEAQPVLEARNVVGDARVEDAAEDWAQNCQQKGAWAEGRANARASTTLIA